MEDKFFKNKELCAAADDKSFDSMIRILNLCPRQEVERDEQYTERIESMLAKLQLERSGRGGDRRELMEGIRS